MPTLVALYNASWELGHHPNAFRDSTTVVFRKPAKADYSLPNSYRPIALLNTLGKTMEKIIPTRINHAVETESLLPRLHIGGRRARSPELALHLLLEAIHAAWLNNEVATVLMLDISGAYDNVSHKRLLHNLRKRTIGGNIAKWIESFFQERKTIIAMPDYTSQPFTTNFGVPQGSPISPILYLFYNADLMEEEGPKKMNLGYVDDISKLIIGTSAQQNCRNLEASFMTREQKWADTCLQICPRHIPALALYQRTLRDGFEPPGESYLPSGQNHQATAYRHLPGRHIRRQAQMARPFKETGSQNLKETGGPRQPCGLHMGHQSCEPSKNLSSHHTTATHLWMLCMVCSRGRIRDYHASNRRAQSRQIYSATGGTDHFRGI